MDLLFSDQSQEREKLTEHMTDLEGQLRSDGISEQKQEELKKALTDTEAALTQTRQNAALVEGLFNFYAPEPTCGAHFLPNLLVDAV